jgi:hypothetical protein
VTPEGGAIIGPDGCAAIICPDGGAVRTADDVELTEPGSDRAIAGAVPTGIMGVEGDCGCRRVSSSSFSSSAS